MPDIQKKKRRAMSIQDMANGNMGESSRRSEPRHRSSYSGPKRPKAGSDSPRSFVRSVDDFDERRDSQTGSTYVNTVDGYGYSGRSGSGRGAAGGGLGSGGRSGARKIGGYEVTFHAGGIMDYAWVVYVAILAVCLMTAMIAYGKGSKNVAGVYYPRNLLTTTGILDEIYDKYKNGAPVASANTGVNAGADGMNQTAGDGLSGEGTTDATGSETITSETSTVLPNSTTGATMAIDDGTPYGSYAKATTHDEVVTELEAALAAGDVGFVGRKLVYEDEESGTLIGYPQSVVEHFTSYMASKPDKRTLFISEIGSTDYSAKNGDAFLIKLPLLKFTVNMGYNDTTLSISGFSDKTLNAGQSATIQPLLPCMYTISVNTSGGSQTSEVEANMNEGNLKINIGVAD